MGSSVVNEQVVPLVDLRKVAVNREFIIILAQRSRHVISVVMRQLLLAKHCDVMVCAVHGRPHQVCCTGVNADILLVDMLLIDGLRNQCPVRSHHEASHLREDLYIAHAVLCQNLIIDPVHALPDLQDIIRLLVRAIWNTDAAGKINELDAAAGLIPKPDSKLKKRPRQCRIVVIGHSIGYQKCMKAEVFHTFLLQNPVRLKNLLFRHPILGVSRVVHDAVRKSVNSARVKAAAHRLRKSSQHLLHNRDMGNVIKIDDCAKLIGIAKLLRLCVIGGIHDLLSGDPGCLRQHQLRGGGTVTPAPIFMQDLHQKRVGCCLYGKILLEARIPCKSSLNLLRVLPNPLLVIQVEGSRILLRNLLYLL